MDRRGNRGVAFRRPPPSAVRPSGYRRADVRIRPGAAVRLARRYRRQPARGGAVRRSAAGPRRRLSAGRRSHADQRPGAGCGQRYGRGPDGGGRPRRSAVRPSGPGGCRSSGLPAPGPCPGGLDGRGAHARPSGAAAGRCRLPGAGGDRRPAASTAAGRHPPRRATPRHHPRRRVAGRHPAGRTARRAGLFHGAGDYRLHPAGPRRGRARHGEDRGVDPVRRGQPLRRGPRLGLRAAEPVGGQRDAPRYRASSAQNDSFCRLSFDTFYDRRNGVAFHTNPLRGAVADFADHKRRQSSTATGTRSGTCVPDDSRAVGRWRWRSRSSRCATGRGRSSAVGRADPPRGAPSRTRRRTSRRCRSRPAAVAGGIFRMSDAATAGGSRSAEQRQPEPRDQAVRHRRSSATDLTAWTRRRRNAGSPRCRASTSSTASPGT